MAPTLTATTLWGATPALANWDSNLGLQTQVGQLATSNISLDKCVQCSADFKCRTRLGCTVSTLVFAGFTYI